jgi:hypothetical protein
MNDAEWHAMLRSHAITPEISAALARGEFTTFVRDRQDALRVSLKTFLSRMCEWGFEDTPPLSSFLMDDEADDGGA